MKNVLILGAGSSFNAGVPLLGGFMEKMWEFARRRKVGENPLSEEDAKIFDRAIEIRDELGTYHGRANFDDRNIEDILSILSFNALAGDRKDRDKLSSFNKAIMFFAKRLASVSKNSACAPPAVIPKTRSPTLKSVTFSPISTTSPANSSPKIFSG